MYLLGVKPSLMRENSMWKPIRKVIDKLYNKYGTPNPIIEMVTDKTQLNHHKAQIVVDMIHEAKGKRVDKVNGWYTNELLNQLLEQFKPLLKEQIQREEDDDGYVVYSLDIWVEK